MTTYRACGLFLFAVCSDVALSGDLALLSPREAQSLIEKIPKVQESKQQGRCPSLATTPFGQGAFLIQVRSACYDSENASGLVSNYFVNRQTGEIREGDSPRITTPAILALTKVLLRDAQKRRITPEEGQCIAMTALKSTVEMRDIGDSLSVQEVRSIPGKLLFAGVHRWPSRHALTTASFTIEQDSMEVVDNMSGLRLTSPGLDSLFSKLRFMKAPLLLSNEAVVEIALKTTAVAQRLSSGCSTIAVTGAGTSEEAFIDMLDECHGTAVPAGALLSVNLRTGAITNPKTLEDAGSKESKETAARLLQDLKRKQSEIERGWQQECSSAR